MQPQTFNITSYSRIKYTVIVIVTVVVGLSARFFLVPGGSPFGWIAVLAASFVLGNFLARRIATASLTFVLSSRELAINGRLHSVSFAERIALPEITDYVYKEYRDFDAFELWVNNKSRFTLNLDKAKESRIAFGKFYDALTANMKMLHPEVQP